MWTLNAVKYTAEPMLYFFMDMFYCLVALGGTYALQPYAVHRCFGGENFGIAYGFFTTFH